jgi:hypothetical protein
MSNIVGIQQALGEIAKLAKEIEEAPNFGPDVWTMKGIDKKAQRIQQLCHWISSEIGTGPGGKGSSGDGYR